MPKIKLPRNIDAEKAILGAMLISAEALNDCLGSLEEDMFYDDPPANKIVFRAMRQLQNKSVPVDVQTVGDEIINMKEAQTIGGIEYLVELCDSAISLSNLEHYIKLVKDQAVLRNLLLAMADVEKKYSDEEIEDISDFIAWAESKINKVAEGRSISTFLNSEELAKRVKESIDSTVSGSSGITGLDTGYTELNRLTLGFQKSDIIILAARPSVGKTALALNFAYKISRRDIPVAIFSAEMPAVMLVKRLISAASNINLSKIISNNLTEGEKYQVNEAIRNIAKTKMFIDESPNIKLMDLVAKARKLKANCPELGLIIIDYLGLITAKSEQDKDFSRQQEVSDISRQLKQLARDLNVPIMVVCQLSRDSEKRDNKRPMLSDLRESGAIEQDADVVMLLYDEFRYKESKVPSKKGPYTKDDKLAENKKKATEKLYESLFATNIVPITLIVAKNRNGAVDDVQLHFYKSYGLFSEPSQAFLAEQKRIKDMTDGFDEE